MFAPPRARANVLKTKDQVGLKSLPGASSYHFVVNNPLTFIEALTILHPIIVEVQV